MENNRNKLIFASNLILFILPLLFYLFLLSHKIDLTTADLGRHLKNGQLFLEKGIVLSTNYYSFTYPSFPVINHHWGSGVIFYLIWRSLGFFGLQFFFILLTLLTFILAFYHGVKKAGFPLTSLLSFIAIPILSQRTEIRPEVFSNLFMVFYFLLLSLFYEGKLTHKWLFFLPLMQIGWVNLHIYFFFGPLFILIFLIDSLILKKKIFLKLLIIFILTSLACFINYFGYKGVFAPFFIFQNYGYRVLENQPLLSIEKLISNPIYAYFKITLFILISCFLFGVVRSKFGIRFHLLLISIFISLVVFWAVRNFAVFGLFFIILTPFYISLGIGNNLKKINDLMRLPVIMIFATFLVVFPIMGGQHYFPNWNDFGWGLKNDNLQAADFFKNNKLRGPVFNNYDIGGYLIYTLPEKEKVFVDNRPEAYPRDFFEKIYIPMQEQEKVFKKAEKEHGFNTVFFYRLDATNWGQKFLTTIINDVDWVPVYVDGRVIIFVKRNIKNEEIIKNFELPREMFSIRG